MALNGLRICWGGVKVEGGKRLECGEPVDDPRTIEEVNRLINEFMRRVERHKDVLLSESTTPFDKAINELSNWLALMETKVKETSDEGIIRMRRAMINIGRKMLQLARQARKKWLKTYRRELEELIEKLRRSETTIIVRGEAFNKNKSFTAHLYTKHLSIVISRVAESGSVTVRIVMTGLRGGINVVTPRLFGDNVLKPMQYGLMMTDGGAIDEYGYPIMGTDHLWQSIIWVLLWPGRNHIHVTSLSLNMNDVNITWKLKAVDHKNDVESKDRVAEEVSKKFNDDEFSIFLMAATLGGDGRIYVKEIHRFISIAIGYSKFKLWGGDIVKRMVGLGFRHREGRGAKVYTINGSKAVVLARKWLADQTIKVLIEDLSLLFDANKLRNLITLANAKVKSKGRFSIEIITGVKMNVHVDIYGYVELVVLRKSSRTPRQFGKHCVMLGIMLS